MKAQQDAGEDVKIPLGLDVTAMITEEFSTLEDSGYDEMTIK